MTQHIIALIGAAGSGKTTVSKHLQGEFSYKRFRFAGKLKQMLNTLGLTWEQLDGKEKEIPCELLCGKTPRQAMQTLGSEWRNMIDPNLWTNALEHELIEHINAQGGLGKEPGQALPALIVIDDCRFHHEVDMLRRLGAEIWCVRRASVEPGIVQRWLSKSFWPVKQLASFVFDIKPLHISELLWMEMKPDVTLFNNATEADLLATVEAALYERKHGSFTRTMTDEQLSLL